jgi:AcrR family transcriptional regulator
MVKTEKRGPGRPKKGNEQETEDTAAQIVQAAKILFRQSGYAAVSINAIVDAVGITKPTLYYYFKDKEALYTAVLCQMLKNGSRYVIQGMNEHETVRAKLLALAVGYFEHSPTSIAVVIRDAMEHLDGAHIKEVQQVHHDFIVMPFVAMIDAGVTRGELKPSNSLLTAHMLLSMLDALLVSYTLGFTRKFPFEEAAGLMIDSFMDGIAVQ